MWGLPSRHMTTLSHSKTLSGLLANTRSEQMEAASIMDHIQREVDRTDPEVPFRASTSHEHHTWAWTFHSRPELYIQPQTLEEIQKVVKLAGRCRRRIVVVGCGHSPSDLTCTSSWMVNLDHYRRVLAVDPQQKTMVVEGGIRLSQLIAEARPHGLTMNNLGSIDEQSIVGAISTATHGSSLQHGLLSESVRSLRLVLSNGRAVRCSPALNTELFRAALVSLGALGIITEVELQLAPDGALAWEQRLTTLADVLTRWNTDLWTRREYTRVWWLPYTQRAIVWSGARTTQAPRAPPRAWFSGALLGHHVYHHLLWLAHFAPRILPAVEWFVFGLQFGFAPGRATSGVEPLTDALRMDCLFSQFVNEWALPLHRGPEALARLSAWLRREPGGGGIPFSARGLWVHSPIEVRVADTTLVHPDAAPRPFLDNTCRAGPTLFLNATLYRARHRDPPCVRRYYQAFEWLMRDLAATPHWAKNFDGPPAYLRARLGDDLQRWIRLRNRLDPDGMFLGEWHRRTLGLGEDGGEDGGEADAADADAADDAPAFPLAEHEVARHAAPGGGFVCTGRLRAPDAPARHARAGDADADAGARAPPSPRSVASSSGAESFDVVHGVEAERSVLLA